MDYDKMTIESLAHYCFKRSGYAINKQDLMSRIKFLCEQYHQSKVNNGVLDDVINCLKVGQKVDWQGKMFYVQEDDGGDRILISNHLDDIVPFYNDWWVDRNEVNCL